MCSLDHDGTLVDSYKDTHLQGRGLWVYSTLFEYLENEEYLHIAAKSRDFVLRFGCDESGKWVCTMDREGRVINPNNQTGYAGAFVAEGLHAYAQATQDQESMDLAIAILKKTWELFNDPRRHVAKRYLPLSYPGMRTLASHMVMIRILTQILNTFADPDLTRLSDEIVDRIVNCFWNPKHQLMNEVLDHEYRCRDDENRDFFCLGHAIETLWMMLDEALRRKDQGLFDLLAQRFHRYLGMAWDHECGGFFNAAHLYRGFEPTKYLWVQEEALVGCMLLIEHTTLDWPRQWFGKIFKYVEEKFSLKPYGYPLYIHSGDRKVTFQPHVARKENYHHPRRLILNILALNRMIK